MDKIMWGEAKIWCEEQGGRLPKLWELLKAYEEKEEGFVAISYWSSTEGSTTGAWYLYFYNGGADYSNKASSYSVRCIFDK